MATGMLCCAPLSMAGSSALPDHAAEQVSDSVYVIHGGPGLPNAENRGFINNPGFVITEAGVVVVDPGSSVQIGRMVINQIERVTDLPVVAAFSTHIHGDHWLGNQAIAERYPDAVLYAHPNLIAEAQSGADQEWVDLMSRLTAGATDGTQAVIPDTGVVDETVISIGGMDFNVYHKGQAHTETDISIMVEQDQVLFTGDLVSNRRLGIMDDGHFRGLTGFLEFLIDLNPRTVVPGHGQTADVSIIAATKDLMDRVYSIVEAGFEEGLTDFEIKPMVLAELAEYSDWDTFEDSIGRIVSLCYLEIEEDNF